MKNFTNNFKQFTSRLSARWLIMALMLLLGTGSAWADKVFYLDLSGFESWKDGNAKFSVNYFGGGVTQKFTGFATSVTIDGKSYYKATGIPDAATTIIWVRHNSSASTPDWNNKWNQTGDLTISSANGKNVVKITGSDAGSWSSTVTECTPATITWKTISATMSKGSTQTISTTLTSGAGSVTYTSSDENVITVSGAKLTAVGNGTATITAKHSTVLSDYCTAESIIKSVTVSTVIPSGTKLYFDFSKATNWRDGHYLSIVGSSNTSYTANNSNTSGAGSYKPKNDATWVKLTEECDGIYSYTTTSDISTGISLWSTNESSYDQVWQTDVILNIKASEFDSAKKCYTLSSTRTYHSDRQTYCFGGSWGSTIPHCCTDPTITLSNNEVTYNGSAQKPTFNGATPTKVTYNDTELANGPTDAGTYTVKVWADASGDFCEVVGVELTDKFIIKGKDPVYSDFTYTNSKDYTGSALSADVAWNTNLAAGVGGAITTYYKVKNAADNTYTNTAPINVGTYTIAVTTVAGGNYVAATKKIVLGDFTIKGKDPVYSDFTYTNSKDYTGSALSADVAWNTNLAAGVGGAITTYYKVKNAADNTYTNTAPINAGTYTIAVTTVAGGNYVAATQKIVLGDFTIKGKDPVYSDFTYTKEKDHTGSALSADVAWKTGLAAGTGGAITTYYKVKDANDNTYTTTQPSAVGIYTVAVTTAAGGNYAASTTKIALGDFTIVEVCNPITNLTWSVTSGVKATYCPGDKVQVTLEYSGTTAKTHSVGGNNEGLSFAISSLANGAVYNITVNKTSTILLTLTGCDGKTATTPTLTFNVMADPATPTVQVVNNIIKCGNDFTQYGKIRITNYDSNYSYKIGVNNDPLDPSAIDANGYVSGLTIADQFTLYAINGCGVSTPSAAFTITETNNKPTITGTNSFQPGGSTVLTSDKGANTIWKTSGGILSAEEGASVTFSADANGKYIITAIYNDCETEFVVSVQDDLYVWVRRPIKKEAAYDQFYHEDQNSEKGGDLFYKEFASLPGDYTQYNQDGKAADATCTDKDGYKWYGFVVSKTAIENDYYFTVHAPNDGGKKGDSQKYGGYYTHTYATQLVDMESDLYFVMDESASGSNRGWYINAPVVVRASGDAMFNGNNFADFVPLYVKDANICGKEVVSFEWQKSSSENGAYTTYKSGEGINNIRTREAGWYRCVVTYGDGKGTATSNAIQVTNTGGTNYSFTSKLPILMVNTNGVGFPKEPASGFPSVDAENLKAKVSVDVIIKKGNDIVYDRKARMNYRGSSSLNFKKKSYAFVSGQDSCVFDKSRHDYVKTKKEKMLNLLGDANYKTSDKDWVLYAATPDPSMMRNRLVFDLYQQMRQGEWGVHSTYVELIVDGEYQGVYVFMDKITANEGRVNITNSDGFIVKFDKTDVADRVEKDGDQKTFATTRTGTKNSSDGITSYDTKIDQRFEIEYPEKEDIEDAGGNWEAFYSKVQQRFEDFETALEEKDYITVRSIIDYDSWADWFILSEFIKNQDGFRASNIFIYNGGKIIATPLWDQELSMDNRTRMAHGSTNPEGLLSTTSSVYSDGFPAPFWFTNKGTDVNNLTGGLLNDPCFVTLVKTKWAEYQAGVLSASNCSTLVAKYHGELDDNIRSREVTKWSYTQAARGTTNSGKYMGYYNDKEGDPTHYSYNASKNAITTWATNRSTDLEANSGLGKAINALKGEALIFTVSPSTVETTPWQQVILTVNAPEGYEYTVSYPDLTAAGAIIKEGNNTYGIKIPRPDNWGTAGNGNSTVSEEYKFTANIEVSGENACGTMQEGTATSTITLKDVTEECSPEIKP